MPNAIEVDTLARTVWGEARGECFQGQVGVAWVVKNRAAQPGWWGRDIISVCLKPFQFSCWNVDDPNRAKLESVTVQDEGFLRASGVAALVILGDIGDPTGGSTHYHAFSVTPSWARELQYVCTIEHHLFYRELR